MKLHETCILPLYMIRGGLHMEWENLTWSELHKTSLNVFATPVWHPALPPIGPGHAKKKNNEIFHSSVAAFLREYYASLLPKVFFGPQILQAHLHPWPKPLVGRPQHQMCPPSWCPAPSVRFHENQSLWGLKEVSFFLVHGVHMAKSAQKIRMLR